METRTTIPADAPLSPAAQTEPTPGDDVVVTPNGGSEMPAAEEGAAPGTAPAEGADDTASPDDGAGAPSDDADHSGSDTPASGEDDLPDYAAQAEADLAVIRRIAPEYAHLTDLARLPGAARFATLREAGLTVEEAFYAVCHPRRTYDNRSHLAPAAPRGAAGDPRSMSAADLAHARELFDDLSDEEIRRLYARCRV